MAVEVIPPGEALVAPRKRAGIGPCFDMYGVRVNFQVISEREGYKQTLSWYPR